MCDNSSDALNICSVISLRVSLVLSLVPSFHEICWLNWFILTSPKLYACMSHYWARFTEFSFLVNGKWVNGAFCLLNQRRVLLWELSIQMAIGFVIKTPINWNKTVLKSNCETRFWPWLKKKKRVGYIKHHFILWHNSVCSWFSMKVQSFYYKISGSTILLRCPPININFIWTIFVLNMCSNTWFYGYRIFT